MHIVVLIKSVPDTYGTRRLDPRTGLTVRIASEALVDEIDERALEAALAYADAHSDCVVSVLTMGSVGAEALVRKCLALGAHRAVLVQDDSLAGADLGLTAEVLATAIGREPFDLVIAGNASTDGGGGVIPAMIAERLDVAHATALGSLVIAEGSVTGRRDLDDGAVEIFAQLPAVVSVTERLPEARFSTFRGIMAAKKKPLKIATLGALGIVADDPAAARSIILSVSSRPERSSGTVVVDEGDGGDRIAAFLRERSLA